MSTLTARAKRLLPPSTRSRALPIAVAAVVVVVAGVVTWNATRGVELIEGESVIELSDVMPTAGESVDPVALNDLEQRLPTLRISNARLASSEQRARHGYGLFPVYETAIVESTNVWSVQPVAGVSQDEAVEGIVTEIESQLTKMLQREMVSSISEDTGNTSIRPESEPSDNPYWFTSAIRPADDGTIQISMTLSTRPPGTFDYTADDLVPDEYADEVALVEPLTDIDGIMLYDFTISGRGGLRLELELEHDNDGNAAQVDCDEFAAAFLGVAGTLQQYDPTVVRDTDAFGGATVEVAGERPVDDREIASFYEGDNIRFSALTRCTEADTLDLPGTILLLNFWAERTPPSS